MTILSGWRRRTGSGWTAHVLRSAASRNLVVKKDIGVTFIDVKSGTPRQWDIIHDAIHVWSGRVRYCSGRYYSESEDVYSDHVVDIPAYAISPEFIEQLGSLIRRVADEKTTLPAPSSTECGFCPISLEDCPQRVLVPREVVVGES